MTIDTRVLGCDGLSKAYQQGSDQLTVLDNINFSVEQGERISIIGASGSGKTTLLNMLGGLDDPSSGSVMICSRKIGDMNESQRARWRNRHLGFVYQFHHLLDEFNAVENVAMPLLIAGVSYKAALIKASALLTSVGMEGRVNHRPNQLSGGERQRVAIARALSAKPSAVLMDEPTGNLDPETAKTVLNLLDELNELFHISFIIVTHDAQVASRMDRVMKLNQGRLEEVLNPVSHG